MFLYNPICLTTTTTVTCKCPFLTLVVSDEAMVQVLVNSKSSRVITNSIPMLELPCNVAISVGWDGVARLLLLLVVVVVAVVVALFLKH